MAVFCLVHGAWHGAWCWERLTPELEGRGQQVVAVDLPAEDPSAGAAEYARVVVDRLAEVTDDVVLVGHSLGGLTIPLVARARPVAHLVFLCALFPVPGKSFIDQVAAGNLMRPGMGDAQTTYSDGSTSWPVEAAIEKLYHDCETADARWAASRLRRQAWTVTDEVTPLDHWPDTPITAIVAADDRSQILEGWRAHWQRERGVEPIVLEGGHSPFLTRPAELADLLIERTVGRAIAT